MTVRPRPRPHVLRARSTVIAAVLGVLAAVAAPSAAADTATGSGAAGGDPAVPRLAYDAWDGDVPIVVTASLRGDVTERFADAEPFTSITDGLVAVARHDYPGDLFRSDVTIADADTGEVREIVRDARYPLLFDKGDGLLFFPDNQGGSGPGDRDPYVNSVWYRDLTTGTERRLAQFTDGDIGALQLAASPNGNRAAFSVGDESRLQWDIWVSSVHGTARQVTHDGQSLYPSFSPDGRTIAYTHQDGPDGCSTEIRLMDVDGADQRTLAAGSCERSLIRPVWLDRETIVAWQWTGDDTGYRPSALVAVSRATGDVRTIVSGRVFDFSVSRTLGLVAFRVVDGRIGIWDPDTGDVVTVAGGTARRGGHLHVDGSLEQAV